MGIANSPNRSILRFKRRHQEFSCGLFWWWRFLNKEYDNGNIHTLRRRLSEIPGDLHELFRDILTRDHHNRGKLLLCIQWVLFTRRPLKPEQLYFGILSGIEPESLIWSGTLMRSQQQSFTDSSSIPLKDSLKSQKSKTPTVQFIHESVKDYFLLKENGLKEIWSGSRKQLRRRKPRTTRNSAYLSQLYIDITTSLRISSSLPPASSKEAAELRQLANKKFPFLEICHTECSVPRGFSRRGRCQPDEFSSQLSTYQLD